MSVLEFGDEIEVRLLKDVPKQHRMKAVKAGTLVRATYTPDGTFWLYHPKDGLTELVDDAREGVDFEMIVEKS